MDIYLCFEGLDGSKPFNSLDCLSEVVLIRLAVGKFFLISALHLDATTPGDILKVGVVEGGFSTSSYQHTHTVGVSHLCFHLNLPDSGSCEAVLISSSRQSVLISFSSPWLSRRGFSLLPSPLLHFALLNCLSFLVGDGSGWGLVFIGLHLWAGRKTCQQCLLETPAKCLSFSELHFHCSPGNKDPFLSSWAPLAIDSSGES